MNTKFLTRTLCTAALSLAFVAAANAQATRTWVSGVGDDANPCSRTAPCKTFAGAISKTAAGGEINVLDPGGFGAVTITKAITIRSDHIEAGVLVSGTNGIVVSAGVSDKIVLEGLDFEGVGTGLNGVQINSAQVVTIVRCSIRNFRGSPGNGVNMVSNTSGGRVFIQDCILSGNLGGVNVNGNGNIASLVNDTVDSNANFALQVNVGNTIGLAKTTLNNSPTAINNLGGNVVSVGPSNIISGAGAPNSTVPFN